jgi:hypothetical protein
MGTGKARPAARIVQALGDLAAALDRLPGPSMLIGGIAVIAHGVPRVTRDIDATIELTGNPIDLIIASMEARGIEARIEDAASFARECAVLLLRHRRSRVEIDLSLASLPFEHEALHAALVATVGGVRLRLARPEDLIIYKSAAWRPQDRQDVERLVALWRPELDLSRVRRIVAEICDALDVPERVAELEDILSAAPKP